jgi:hypothetical protein
MNIRLIFAAFAAAILLTMIREWSAPAACPRPVVTPVLPLATAK